MIFLTLSQLKKFKPALKTYYIPHVKKNTKNNECFPKCGLKHAGVSLRLCIHSLLNEPQYFLFPSQILSGNKLEVVAEILGGYCELCVLSTWWRDSVGWLLALWSLILRRNLSWRVQSSTQGGQETHVPEPGLLLHHILLEDLTSEWAHAEICMTLQEFSWYFS